MKKQLNNQKVMSILMALKPWVIPVVLLLILHYTGALNDISFFTQSMLMKSGVMDAEPAEIEDLPGNFDYDFSIKDLDGNIVDVSQFKGKVVFLNLWATWCGPCRVEMPSIQELYDQVDHSKITFIMLSLDVDENHNKIVKYISDKKFSFPVYQTLGYLPRQLRVPTIPTTFVIGADGKVKTKKVGSANYNTDEFREFLKGL